MNIDEVIIEIVEVKVTQKEYELKIAQMLQCLLAIDEEQSQTDNDGHLRLEAAWKDLDYI